MPVKLRDGVTIYTDIFRPNDDLLHPAIMAMSPYGKEIGSQWLDDTPNHAGIPMEAIDIPAYIVASYTNPIHTYGTFKGYRHISSKEKWLRIHNTGEWDDYYNPAHTEELRRFFDRYLKGENNGWEKTPRVRVSVLNPGGKDIVDREEDFSIPRTQYKKLYLDNAKNSLSKTKVDKESYTEYDSDRKKNGIRFDMKMAEDTEILGYMKLRLWVEALDHDDMDLFVKVEKRRPSGLPCKFTLGPGMDMSAKGYIRVSLRALDETKSTKENPRQSMAQEQKLHAGEIVPLLQCRRFWMRH